MPWLMPLAFLVGLLGCAADVPEEMGSAPEHVVARIEGQLELRRAGWTAFTPTVVGRGLGSADVLRLDGASRASVVCADLTLVEVPAGSGPVPCADEGVVLVRGERRAGLLRCAQVGDFPTIIAPRATNVLTPRPTLRWTPLPGATGYRVSIRGWDLSWSADVGPRTELVYPDDAPALTPGEVYKLSVSAGARSSDEEGLPGLGFVLLTDEQARDVRATAERLDRLDLPLEVRRFLLAKLYASDRVGLYAESLELLEDLALSTDEPSVQLAAGELYSRLGLQRLAEDRYLDALALAARLGDPEGRALARDALGEIYSILGNTVEAVRSSQEALELYRQLGDAKKMAEITGRLAPPPRP